MALSMRERLGLQKQVKANLAALQGGDMGMRERLRVQKEVKSDVAKLKGVADSQTPADSGQQPIDPGNTSPGDPVVWRNEMGEIRGNYRGVTDDGTRAIIAHNGGQQSGAPISEVFPAEGGEAPAPQKSDSEAAMEAAGALMELRPFIPRSQMSTLANLIKSGEEKQAYRDKVQSLVERIKSMPVTYEQDGKGMDSVAYLHYFTSAGDYYITEKDMEGDGTTQAFGHADAGMGMGELGYISIEELTQAGAELDLYFTPAPLKQVVNGTGGGGDDAQAYAERIKSHIQAGSSEKAHAVASEIEGHDKLVKALKGAGFSVNSRESARTILNFIKFQMEKATGEAEPDPEEGGTHYSDLILQALVEHHGWSPDEYFQDSAVKKDVGGQLGGQINPDGNRIVTAQFASGSKRYLQLVAGFDKPVTVDGRPALSGDDADVRAVAADFNSQVTEWAVENAADPGTLKVESNRTPEQPDTLTTQAAEGNFNDLPLPGFIEKLKEAYSADEDLEGAKVAAAGYLEANREDLEEAA